MTKEFCRSQKTMNKVHKETERNDLTVWLNTKMVSWYLGSIERFQQQLTYLTSRVMYGNMISNHRNTTNIILIKSTVTYLYENSSTHELQPILCKADYMYMG